MGVGKIEIVLSIIFQILSNIVRDTSDTFKDKVLMFKQTYGEFYIKLSIEIMTKNQERYVTEEEEELEDS